MTLRDLEIGQLFKFKNDNRTIYKVCSKNLFNARAGTATRDCLSYVTNKIESRQSKREVVLCKTV